MYPREKQGNGVAIGSYEDYQKLPANKKYLMPLIQTNNRFYICQGAFFFTCLKVFKTGKFINRRQHFRTNTISPNYLAQLRRKCKSFSLTSFDKWKHERDTTTTWHKNDIQHNKYYQWSGYWFSGFLRNATPLYTKWFLPVNNANIFRTDIIRNLADHRRIQ